MPNVTLYTRLHTPLHTRLTALCPGLPGWAGTRKVQPIWILLKQQTVSGSGISLPICKSAPCSRQITMPAPHHSSFFTGRMLFLPPNQQHHSTEGNINDIKYGRKGRSNNYWHLFMSVTVSMLICIQWHIYLQCYVANMHVEVGMQQANGADCRPQYTPTCLESSDCSRSSRWMQKINFEAFSCRHFNFKNSAPECTRTRHFHSEGNNPSRTHLLGAYGASTAHLWCSTLPHLQNPTYATVYDKLYDALYCCCLCSLALFLMSCLLFAFLVLLAILVAG